MEEREKGKGDAGGVLYADGGCEGQVERKGREKGLGRKALRLSHEPGDMAWWWSRCVLR